MYVEGCDRRKGQKKKSVGVCLECAVGMPPENYPNISCQMLILVELRKDTNHSHPHPLRNYLFKWAWQSNVSDSA
jgi:hypothetical protein